MLREVNMLKNEAVEFKIEYRGTEGIEFNL